MNKIIKEKFLNYICTEGVNMSTQKMLWGFNFDPFEITKEEYDFIIEQLNAETELDK